ncbi:MAG TPA: choice-of-anchor tandem repeat GloVer-containing protein, partial [Bacteroidia bacterium]|nr:choice-of-anchor tandem repeat GloVer-containing protein [Bacteroidia bacterium]
MKKIYFLISALFFLGLGTGKAQYTQLLNFNGPNGAEPFGTLIANANNTVLYGTAYLGGVTHDSGCIFSIHADGSNYKVLLDFTGPNGIGPNSPLTLIGGKLFGSANTGGANDSGLIFSMDTNGGGFKDLFDFSGPNGKNPYNNLVFDSNSGILYGIADGGLNHIGVLFSVDTSGGGYRDLYDFTIATGEYPLGLTLVANKFYG